jgi:hypothetical protein
LNLRGGDRVHNGAPGGIVSKFRTVDENLPQKTGVRFVVALR